MKKYVITIMDMTESVQMASRCIETGLNNGVEDIKMWKAITPKDNPYQILKDEMIPGVGFTSQYSKVENAVSCFLSHYMLWKHCVEINETVMILEHDAKFISPLQLQEFQFKGCISIGAPSYGKFKQPPLLGVNKLVSKEYFPGAHAYIIKPKAAQLMIERAKIDAEPTDTFLHNQRFSFLEELYPWVVQADDTFTTIQEFRGIAAKHSYLKNKENYGVKHAR